MSSISTLEFAVGESIVVAEHGGTKQFLLASCLKRINSSCSSGRERRKSVKWDERTINAAADQGNLEMVKYCVANECPIDEEACAVLPKTVISSASNTYAKKRKRLGIRKLPHWRLKMVIFIYSNILLSVSMMNIT